MPTTTLYLMASFGSAYAGLSTVGYRLYDDAQPPVAVTERITAGITHRGAGDYVASVNVPVETDGSFRGFILWNTGTDPDVTATDTINIAPSPAVETIALSGWPSATEIARRLAAAGFTPPSATEDLTRYVLAAVAAFESETGYRPFLAADTASERRFSPDRRGTCLLDLKAGAVTIVSVTLGDTALTAESDFWPEPMDLLPYTLLQFRAPVFGPPGSIHVSARWGYAGTDAVPRLAFEAVAAEACRQAAEDLASLGRSAAGGSGSELASANAQLTRVREGDVEREFASLLTERRAAFTRWEADFARGVASYRLGGLA